MEELTQFVDNYCERTAPGLMNEPLNALTNLAFLVAAVVIWQQLGKERRPITVALTVVLFVIGLGSGLFHTFATRWAGISDVLPILAFILLYIYGATRHILLMPVWMSLGATVLSFAYAPLATMAFSDLFPWLKGSAGYASVALLIVIYAVIARGKSVVTSQGLLIGAGLLAISIGFRTADYYVCGFVPFGTHFIWHILNAIMLGWMIRVLHIHMHQGSESS